VVFGRRGIPHLRLGVPRRPNATETEGGASMEVVKIRADGRLSKWTRVGQWLPKRGKGVIVVRGCTAFHLWYKRWRGYVCTHAVRSTREGAETRISFPTEFVHMRKKRVGGGAVPGGPTNLAAVESTVLGSMPAFIAHCAVTRYEDGDARKVGWINITTRGGMWQITAKDPDSAASITATGQTLDDALALIDLLLGADDAPWESDAYLARNGKGGHKKS